MFPDTADRSGGDSPHWVLMPVLPLLLFSAALALAYGYEIFSFGLTADEEIYGELDNAGYAAKWVEESRWAMSLLTLAVPSPVVPGVSAGLGVALSGTAWWLLSRRHLGLSPWQAAAACSFAGTIPVLAFIFSFSTIAFGIGVGNMLLVVYAWGLSAASWAARGAGALAGAAAVGIYDSFLVALAALSLALILARPRISAVALAFGSAVSAFTAARLFAWIASAVTQIPIGSYVDHITGGQGFFSDALGLVPMALISTAKVLFLWEGSFGLHSPWLAVVIISLTLMAAYSAFAPGPLLRERSLRLAAVAGLVLLPFGAAVSVAVLPLRSMIYLPVITLVLASAALQYLPRLDVQLRRVGTVIAAGVIVLAVIGNATISNRLFASAQTTYALDQQLAFMIGHEKDKLLSGDQMAELPVVVSGRHSWPEGRLTPYRETLGMSFFDWPEPNERAPAFLRMHGVKVENPTAEQRGHARSVLNGMPHYPLPGWIQVNDGMLLVKFPAEIR